MMNVNKKIKKKFRTETYKVTDLKYNEVNLRNYWIYASIRNNA